MKPMLAAATDGQDLQYPLLASPKLDGIRCIIHDGIALSRSLKPIPNKHCQLLFGRPELEGFDGELIVGNVTAKDVFQQTSSGVMSMEGTPIVRYHVFDDHGKREELFHERLSSALRRIKKLKTKTVAFVEHESVETETEVLDYETRCLFMGYEGVMLRDPAGAYKYGRSTLREGWLLKLKRFLDSEAVVTGCTQLMHNTNAATTNELGQTERSSHKAGKVPLEALGALTVKDCKTGVEFEIGTGFDADQRRLLWLHRKFLKGRLAKYKYQSVGVKDKPRFPVFIGWRDEQDL